MVSRLTNRLTNDNMVLIAVHSVRMETSISGAFLYLYRYKKSVACVLLQLSRTTRPATSRADRPRDPLHSKHQGTYNVDCLLPVRYIRKKRGDFLCYYILPNESPLRYCNLVLDKSRAEASLSMLAREILDNIWTLIGILLSELDHLEALIIIKEERLKSVLYPSPRCTHKAASDSMTD